MGITRAELNFLRYVHKFGNFNKTVTIGRQSLLISKNALNKLIPADNKYKPEKYVDKLLKDYFHSTLVNSIDISDYENATIIHDMNTPIPKNLKHKYNTVIDSGSLEHVYNITQALENVSFLCKQGGQIIHMLPANNNCGHGFWQMSPELFFSLYSNRNGYKNTEVFLVRMSHPEYFYKVIKPENGRRVIVYSKDELYLFVRTILSTTKFSHSNVQQSDYVYAWDNKNKKILMNNLSLFNFIRRHELIYNLTKPLNKTLHKLMSKIEPTNGLTKFNPNLIK